MKICLKCRRKLFDSDIKCDKCQCNDLMEVRMFTELYNEFKLKTEQEQREARKNNKFCLLCKYVFPEVVKPSESERQKQSEKDKLRCNVESEEFINIVKQQSKKEKTTSTVQHQSKPLQVVCPKCNSTQIQMVARKWSLMTGIFTNKVDRVCVNCKHKF